MAHTKIVFFYIPMGIITGDLVRLCLSGGISTVYPITAPWLVPTNNPNTEADPDTCVGAVKVKVRIVSRRITGTSDVCFGAGTAPPFTGAAVLVAVVLVLVLLMLDTLLNVAALALPDLTRVLCGLTDLLTLCIPLMLRRILARWRD